MQHKQTKTFRLANVNVGRLQVAKLDLHTVIYREGGKLNGRWTRTAVQSTYAACARTAADIERMGYPCLVPRVRDLEFGGLPDASPEDYKDPDEVARNGAFARNFK